MALALDAAAGRAAGRGAQTVAAELAELAIRSTPESETADLRRRHLTAAELHLRVGDLGAGRALLELVLPEATGAERAHALLRLTQTRDDVTVPEALLALDEALEAAADERGRAEVELDRSAWLHVLGGITAARPAAHAAVVAARRAGDPVLLAGAVVRSSTLDLMAGERVDLEALREAARTEQAELSWPLGTYPPGVALGMCLQFADRLDEAREVLEEAVARAAASEDESSRHQGLLHLAETECRAGRYDRAVRVGRRGARKRGADGVRAAKRGDPVREGARGDLPREHRDSARRRR